MMDKQDLTPSAEGQAVLKEAIKMAIYQVLETKGPRKSGEVLLATGSMTDHDLYPPMGGWADRTTLEKMWPYTGFARFVPCQEVLQAFDDIPEQYFGWQHHPVIFCVHNLSPKDPHTRLGLLAFDAPRGSE